MATIIKNTGWVNTDEAVLEEYYTDNKELTGREKPNTPGDPDYVARFYDPERCLPAAPDAPTESATIYVHIGPDGPYRNIVAKLMDNATYNSGSPVPAPKVIDLDLAWNVNQYGEIVPLTERVTFDTGRSQQQTTQGNPGELISCLTKTPSEYDIIVGDTTYHLVYVYSPEITNCEVV